VYVILVLIGGFVLIPGRDSGKHLTALRYLDTNTRLSESLLLKPTNLSIEESIWLDREAKELKGKYIKTPVEGTKEILVDNVAEWPSVKSADAFPAELTTEPDWVFLNSGSLLQVWTPNKSTPDRAHVLAIVPSGSKWIVLLRRQELSPQALTASKDAPVVRLEVVAGKPDN
jgi:hypothetical protein